MSFFNNESFTDILFGVFASLMAALILDVLGVKIYNYITGSDRDVFWRTRTKTLEELDPKMSFEELKRKIRIIVIDDEDIFPVDLFKSSGYNLDRWENVKDYDRLENGEFDIIILDIRGVAEHISAEDGLGVLESVKKANPTQVIIAFSMHEYDLSKQKFFRLADDTIKKPTKFTDIKEKIDKLIAEKFSVSYPLEVLRTLLITNNFQPKEIRRLEKKIARFHKYGTEPNWNEVLRFIRDSTLKRKIRRTCLRILKNLKS